MLMVHEILPWMCVNAFVRVCARARVCERERERGTPVMLMVLGFRVRLGCSPTHPLCLTHPTTHSVSHPPSHSGIGAGFEVRESVSVNVRVRVRVRV